MIRDRKVSESIKVRSPGDRVSLTKMATAKTNEADTTLQSENQLSEENTNTEQPANKRYAEHLESIDQSTTIKPNDRSDFMSFNHRIEDSENVDKPKENKIETRIESSKEERRPIQSVVQDNNQVGVVKRNQLRAPVVSSSRPLFVLII